MIFYAKNYSRYLFKAFRLKVNTQHISVGNIFFSQFGIILQQIFSDISLLAENDCIIDNSIIILNITNKYGTKFS